MKRTTELTDYDGKDILYMNSAKMLILFSLFVWGFRLSREFFTHMRTPPLPRRAAFDLCSALMANEQ